MQRESCQRGKHAPRAGIHEIRSVSFGPRLADNGNANIDDQEAPVQSKMKESKTLLAGKTALVTGSTGGLGRGIAEGLAAAGCNIVLHGLAATSEGEDACASIGDAYSVDVRYVRADLTDPTAIESMVNDLHETGKRIDVLVNNAVVRHFAPVEAFPREAWDAALAVNVSAAFHLIRLTLPGMRAHGWGRIFNMTSVYGSRGATNRIDYVTTKSALLGMTRAVAMETIGQGVTCNAVCPGTVLTPNIEMRVQALMDQRGVDRATATREFLAGKQPHADFIDARDIAALVVFLCGPASGDITGAMLPMEGGWLAG